MIYGYNNKTQNKTKITSNRPMREYYFFLSSGNAETACVCALPDTLIITFNFVLFHSAVFLNNSSFVF